MAMAIEVSGLYTYPIKGCAANPLQEAELTDRGIAYDREWMLVGSNNQFLSQRTHPELALVRADVADDSLKVHVPDMHELAIPLNGPQLPTQEEVPVTVFKKPGSGMDQGAEAADYFSDYLQRPARLLRVKQPRAIKPECRIAGVSERISFVDGFPILLTSQSSLSELNAHLREPIPIDRFRPNIVVTGEGLPAYDEDYWRQLRIGQLQAYVVRACARCPVPNVDQKIGVLPKERLVTEALRKSRRGVDSVDGSKSEFFGQNLTHVFEEGITIRIGDSVSVLERAAEPNVQIIVNV